MSKIRILAILLFCSASVHATYSGYDYRRVFTILHAKVPNSDQTNFPVLISTTDATLATVPNSGHLKNSSGYDLIFSTMSDCSYLLNWDTETYNASTGNIIVWVKVPTVATASDTSIYMCYGNSLISSYLGYSTATWDSNYKSVWHLPNGSNLSLGDSTSNSLTLTNNNVTATSGNIDVIELLIKSGARKDVKDVNDKTPLDLAPDDKKAAIMKLFAAPLPGFDGVTFHTQLD